MTELSPSDARAFRSALGSFTTGVTIVTTRDASGSDVGLTANSFNSVSLEPPMVLWSLGKSSTNLAAFLEAKHFAVHILASDQDKLSNIFAKSGIDRFAGLTLQRGEGGVPLLSDCTARFQCRTAFQYEGGDHVIFVGEVTRFDHSDRPPLVFHGGRYGLLVKTPQAQAPAPGSFAAEPEGSFSEGFLGYLLGRAHYQLFLPMRRELEKRGLGEAEFFVLSVLGIGDRRTVEELNALLAYTGVRATPTLLNGLAAHGFVACDGAVTSLTPAGRQVMIELMAIAKAAEAEIEGGLDHSEQLLLKDLLKRVIRRTDPGIPALWPPAG